MGTKAGQRIRGTQYRELIGVDVPKLLFGTSCCVLTADAALAKLGNKYGPTETKC